MNKITLDGTNLDDHPNNVAGFAFYSLKLGLHAFFSTYKKMKYNLHLFENDYNTTTKDSNASHEYYECSAETILHFHHFTELIIKDILRTVHPLMADIASEKPIVLKKLLKNEPLTKSEESGVRSIEFKKALERLVKLVKSKEMDNHISYEFIRNYNDILIKLNNLRDRIWHRGTFILRYDSLDKFICKYFFPFLKEILRLDCYSKNENIWKYKPLKIDFDPFDYLYNERNNYNIGKYSLAKELGRAAYENPLCENTKLKIFNDELKNRAEASAKAEYINVSKIEICPVCNVKSLVIYDDIETEGENEDGTYDRALQYTWQVQCMCCSFEINNHLKNGLEYGIPLPNYWTAKYL